MARFRWEDIPYPDEKYGPIGEGSDAGSWPLRFFKRDAEGNFYDLKDNKIAFDIKTPTDEMDFNGKQLEEVKNAVKNLTPKQKEIAKYWNSENVILLHYKNVFYLLQAYKVSAMNSARILSITGDAFNDAMAIAFYFKYKFQIPRPIQLDKCFKPYLNTSYDPSYPVGHGVIAGMVEVLLSYFFPCEKAKLEQIACASAMSRVYGGIHYPIDVEQGLRLGKQIGCIIVNTIKDESNSYGNTVNNIYTEGKSVL